MKVKEKKMKVKETPTTVLKDIGKIQEQMKEAQRKLDILNARRGTMTGGRRIG